MPRPTLQPAPPRISDLDARTVTAHIFEPLDGDDPLARPAGVVPRLADGMPAHNADLTVWTGRLKAGIVVADEAVLRGRPRPLVAADAACGFLQVAAADMPCKVLVHRIAKESLHPWVSGDRRTPSWNDWWHMVDIDPARRAAHG